MRKTILFIVVIAISTSCMTTKKFDKILNTEINNHLIPATKSADNIQFQLKESNSENAIKESNKTKSQFIPALLFWKWNNTIEFELNQSFLEEFFKNSFMGNPRIPLLQEKLSGKKLVIKVESMPTEFVYTNQGEILILILYYQVGTLKAIYPVDKSLHITYEIIENNDIIKTKDITVKRPNVPTDNTDGSTKILARKHFNKYETYISYLTDDLIKQLIKEF